MRLPDVIGVVAALVVGGILTVLLLASAVVAPPTLATPVPPTIPPIAIATPVTRPSATPGVVEPGATPAHPIAIGEPAPPLQVTLTDGSLMSTEDFTGQPLWINFMATWCPQCVEELPLMERYQGDLGDQMTVLVVDVGEDRQTVNSFMRDLNIDLPVGVDDQSVSQRAWGAFALPVHFFIDADGVVKEIVYGGAPLEVFDAAIVAAVPDFVAPDPE